MCDGQRVLLYSVLEPNHSSHQIKLRMNEINHVARSKLNFAVDPLTVCHTV
jgi:hypothetical protein